MVNMTAIDDLEERAQIEADAESTRVELLRLARKELARQGGKASMRKRTKEEKSEMGRKGARARWGLKSET